RPARGLLQSAPRPKPKAPIAASPRRLRRAEPRISSPWRSRAAPMPATSPSRMWSDRPCSLHHEIDAAVLRLALVGIVTGNGLCRTIADRAEPVGRQSRLDQVVGDRLGTLLGQRLVGRLV